MKFFRKKKQPAPQAAEPGQEAVEAAPEPAEQPPLEPAESPEEPETSQETSIEAPEEAPPDQNDEAAEETPDEAKRGILARLANRLSGTRDKIAGSIDRITLGRKIDDELLDELEEVLVTADLGVKTSVKLIEEMRAKARRNELSDAEALKQGLKAGIEKILLDAGGAPPRENDPHVILVVGVNGVGKTTTIGKLAHRFSNEGRKVLLGAADTFRAAAAEQLEIWAGRSNAELVRQKEGADPSAVAFDAVEAGLSRGCDLVIIDTAGRLHTKVNLMDELVKVHRVVGKKLPGAPHEVLLVLDATTGQNALRQAQMFNQAVPLTGLILTKLDGTAKGGIVVAIADEMNLPICYVGLGEGIDDLRPFDPQGFAAAILGNQEE